MTKGQRRPLRPTAALPTPDSLALSLLLWVPPAVMSGTLAAVILRLVADFLPSLDPQLMASAWPYLARTFVFALVTAAAQTLIGLAAALAVLWMGPGVGRRLALITIFALPYAVPSSLIALIFRFGVGPQSAYATMMEQYLGIPATFWLIDNALAGAALASIWQFFPFAFVLLFLALKTTPSQYLRSARVDGAPFLALLWDVVISRIWSVLLSILFLRMVFMLVKFDTPYVFTEGIASDEDLSTVELSRLLSGSLSPTLPVIAWGLLTASVSLALIYLLFERVRKE